MAPYRPPRSFGSYSEHAPASSLGTATYSSFQKCSECMDLVPPPWAEYFGSIWRSGLVASSAAGSGSRLKAVERSARAGGG
jgi:hypothetical protein